MSNTRLIFKTVELTPDGILIRSIEILDAISGETIRPANLTPELCNLIKVVEIDIDAFFEIEQLKKKNKTVHKLIKTFKLYS